MKKRKLIYDEDLLFKILVISGFVMFLKDGIFGIILMFIYFFINERIEKEKYEKARDYCEKHGIPFD